MNPSNVNEYSETLNYRQNLGSNWTRISEFTESAENIKISGLRIDYSQLCYSGIFKFALWNMHIMGNVATRYEQIHLYITVQNIWLIAYFIYALYLSSFLTFCILCLASFGWSYTNHCIIRAKLQLQDKFRTILFR